MKKSIIIVFLTVITLTSFGQSGNYATSTSCTVPAGWTSCTSSCWFSECCIVWNPNVSEGGCGCWFGVALCKTAKIGANALISNTSSPDATVKFSFDRFQELIDFLNSNGIAASSISTSLSSFQKNYLTATGKVPVQTADYISFQNNYVSFINKLTVEQKNLVTAFVNERQKAEMIK